MKIRIVEKGGISLKRILHRSDPLSDNKCKCLICKTKGGKCRREGVVYEIKCETCNDTYTGETARNGYTRIKEHIKQASEKSKDSVLHRHIIEKHTENESPPTFSAKIIKTYPKSTLR